MVDIGYTLLIGPSISVVMSDETMGLGRSVKGEYTSEFGETCYVRGNITELGTIAGCRKECISGQTINYGDPLLRYPGKQT